MMALCKVKPAFTSLGIFENNFEGFFSPCLSLTYFLFFHYLLFYFYNSIDTYGTKKKTLANYIKQKEK